MDRLIDWRWGIDTHTGSSALSDRVGRFADAAQNLPVNYYLLFRLVGRTVFKPDDVFYDIGCGAGRVLCYVARKHISRVVGVELSPAFADEARKNAMTLRGRVSPIEVRCGDAADMDYSDGTVFFLYHPFGPGTLRAVLDRIRKSVDSHRRPILFMYQNPVHSSVFRSSGWLHYAGRREGILSRQPMDLWACDTMESP
jgi:SAM-dependent methyltransferase